MLPLKLGKEVYYQRVPFITAQALVILDAVICRVTSVWRDYLNAIFSQFCAQLVSLKRAMTVQDSWHRLNHISVESNLYQGDAMVIRRFWVPIVSGMPWRATTPMIFILLLRSPVSRIGNTASRTRCAGIGCLPGCSVGICPFGKGLWNRFPMLNVQF